MQVTGELVMSPARPKVGKKAARTTLQLINFLIACCARDTKADPINTPILNLTCVTSPSLLLHTCIEEPLHAWAVKCKIKPFAILSCNFAVLGCCCVTAIAFARACERVAAQHR